MEVMSRYCVHTVYRNTFRVSMLIRNPFPLKLFVMNHFTVVCSVSWPLNCSEAGGDPDPPASLHLHEESREVCINGRSIPASLPFKGQVTKQTTVK